jgi:hypothetical protein
MASRFGERDHPSIPSDAAVEFVTVIPKYSGPNTTISRVIFLC